jgi:nucleoside-diphosphate-sugar epimerase
MDKLVIGCGYLGRRVAALWKEGGYHVFATTRNTRHAQDLQQAQLEPVVCDVLDVESLKALPRVESAVYCVGFDRQAGVPKHEVYVRGLANVLDALPTPRRFIYIGSTGVYGQGAGEAVSETFAPQPADPSGETLLEAEQTLRSRLSAAVILRFAGIYGPGRLIRSQALSAGDAIAADPDKWLNLIHVDDGAAAVLAAEKHAQPGETYNVSDDAPVCRRDFYRLLADLLGAPAPRFAPEGANAGRGRERGNRRIVNRRMHEELHVELRYPTYREGLPACLENRRG